VIREPVRTSVRPKSFGGLRDEIDHIPLSLILETIATAWTSPGEVMVDNRIAVA
jgi:hypothetical protein